MPRVSRLVRVAAAWAIALAWLPGARDDQRVLLEGLADLEGWETDAGSRLLAVREGTAALGARLRLFSSVRLGAGFEVVAAGRIEGGSALEDGTETELEQAFVRWSRGGAATIVVDAGKVTVPLGNFAKRYRSDVNPLVGSPDSYDVSYPVGLVVATRWKWLDVRAAALDRPLANENYVPESDSALRPALAAGVTPIVGLRIGAYWTAGPYLGDGVTPFLPGEDHWKDFDQSIAGMELEFSRGYFELNGDVAWSEYDVPTLSERARGTAWYLEPKYTWTPRFFTALRYEYNDYPYIAPVAPGVWIAPNAAFRDVELGLGWRLSAGALAKLSYRRDWWDVDESLRDFLPDGYAVAVQLSWAFDVRSWFDRPER